MKWMKWGLNVMEFATLKSQLPEIAKCLAHAHPRDIIRWGVEHMDVKRLTLACSFGYEDVALVDIVQQVNPDVEIFYLDTALFFPETYQVHESLTRRYQKEMVRVSTSLTLLQQEEEFGAQLWKTDSNLCCQLRKVEPLRNHLRWYQGWITGIRREQSPTRANSSVVEWDETFQLIKLNPLAYWNSSQVWEYIREHDIPYNPLHDQGYPSIGCMPCTRQVKEGEDLRAGRWSGSDKTECGLHG